ncbi:MAG: sensor histidine kinase [Bulleidia sp.]
MRKAGESPVLKVLGVILIGALLAGETLLDDVMQHQSSYSLDTVNPAATYYETDVCYVNMLEEAESVAQEYMRDVPRFEKLQDLNERFSPEKSNSRYQICSADGKMAGNNLRGSETYGRTVKFPISVMDGSASLASDPEDAVWFVTIAVTDPITVDDRYMASYTEFQRISRLPSWRVLSFVRIAFYGLMIALMGWECRSAGHRKGKEGITISWLDRIPYEFVLLALVILLILRQSNPIITGIDGILLAIVVITTAARIKSGTLFSGTLLSHLIHLLQNGNTGLNILILICLLIIYVQTFYLARTSYSDAGAFVLMTAADAILTYHLLMTLYGNRVLSDAADQLASGNLEYRIDDSSKKRLFGSMHQLADSLNSIGEGMKISVRDQMKAERMQAALITNVSHDLKTPLTSVITYTDLLQKEHTPDQEKEYLEALSRQSARLKRLCEDIVEASKASSGMIEADPADISLKEFSGQAAAEYQERLQLADVQLILDLKPENPIIRADGRLLWRVISNLLSNVVKYAQPGTRAYFSSREEPPGMITISLKNTSREQLNIEPEELMERFVRGDNSRHSEGSGLGLSIARSLTETMGGTFHLSIKGDLFEAKITLPMAERKPDEPQA